MIDITTPRLQRFVYALIALAMLLISGLLAMQIDILAEINDPHLLRDFRISLIFSAALLILAGAGFLFFRALLRQQKANLLVSRSTEESLRRSQQFVARINDLVPDSIYILDFVQQRMVYQNKAVSTVLGYSETDLHEERWDVRLSNLHPDDREAAFENLNRFLEMPQETIIESEQRVRHKDGSWRWFQVRETVFARSEDGAPIQILGVAADITERKRVEETLRAREEQYRELYTVSHRHTQELSLLDKVRSALLSEIDFAALIRVIVEGVAEAFGYRLVSIYLLQDAVLRLQYQVGYDRVVSEVPLTKGVIGKVARSGQPIWLNDVSTDPDFLSALEGVVSEVCVPLFDKGKVVGVLNVESSGDIVLGKSDLRLLTALSGQLSIAVGRARLYSDLQKSEERYRVVSDLVSDYAYSFDVTADGAFIHDWITDSYSRLTGYTLEEAATNTSTQLLFPPDEQARVNRDLAATLNGQETGGEYRIITKNREERWVNIRRRPVWDAKEQRIVKIYGVAQDITASKLAELQLQSYAREVEDLYNNAPCAYHSMGADGIFIRINDTGLNWLGYNREELIGQMGFGDLLTDAGRATCDGAFLRLQQTGQIDDLEFEVQRKDGTHFMVLLNATAVFDEQGRFLMSRATMFDITDRKNIQMAEQEQRALAEGFRELATRLSQSLDLDEVLDLVLSTVRRVVPHNSASVMLIENGRARIVRHFGFSVEEIEKMVTGRSFALDDLETLRRISTTRQPLIIGDTGSDSGWHSLSPENALRQQSYLGVPILLDSDTVGMLHLTSPEKHFFTPQHAERLITFAAQAAVAIQNARLYKQAQELAMLEERQRLARDLHDAVSQTLFSASVVAETLPRIWERQTPEETRSGLNELMRLTRGALAEMRNLLAELRPKALTETDLGVLLKQLTDASGGHIQIPIKLEVAIDRKTLPPDTQIAFYRIAQEALSNIIKHARAHQVEVKFTCSEGVACLQISDDGRGFDVEQAGAGHYGLQIMRERAIAAGATVTITSQPGSGTRIIVDWHADVKAPV